MRTHFSRTDTIANACAVSRTYACSESSSDRDPNTYADSCAHCDSHRHADCVSDASPNRSALIYAYQIAVASPNTSTNGVTNCGAV